MKLFCLPYAGGSQIIYYKWKKVINNHIELRPIELKGRGARYAEGFYNDLNEAVEDIYNIIKDEITDSDYGIFGHSMGSILTYELYHKIVKEGKPEPKCLFFSAHRAPTYKVKEKKYLLSDKDFMKKVIDLGGTPKEVIESKELLDFVLPILRNDFKILEEYIYEKKENPIECDVSVLIGEKDSMTLDEAKEWNKLVAKEINIYSFEGDHFFINDEYKRIINIIEEHLL
jgi:surfactin synthase thioesterase subunit